MHDFIRFLKEEKVFWIVPLILFAALVVVIVVMSNDDSLSPFIYEF